MDNRSLHTKYRPRKLKDVIGQAHVVKALDSVLRKGTSHTFLFSGPSGAGKTTLARIASRIVGCKKEDLVEVDAATRSGVDDMRNIQEMLRYRPFGQEAKRAVIIDECHQLSKSAWNSLLKVTEEPPAWVYFFFCTTEVGKVPATIKTRSAAFTLKDVSSEELIGLVTRVAEEEQYECGEDVLRVVVAEAYGSPRQALVNLALCGSITSKKEAVLVLQSASDSATVIDLCRHLVRGGSWKQALAYVNKLADENTESVRIVVVNYVAAVLKKASDKEAPRLLEILDAFSTPYNASEKMAPLLLSVGSVMFGD